VGTVSNVLNRPTQVAESTRARVLAAIDELGFVRHSSASQLRAGRSHTVGLVVLDIGNPFFTDLARGLEAEAAEHALSSASSRSSGSRACSSRRSATRGPTW
jgi:LacI family transcriptional regulator